MDICSWTWWVLLLNHILDVGWGKLAAKSPQRQSRPCCSYHLCTCLILCSWSKDIHHFWTSHYGHHIGLPLRVPRSPLTKTTRKPVTNKKVWWDTNWGGKKSKAILIWSHRQFSSSLFSSRFPPSVQTSSAFRTKHCSLKATLLMFSLTFMMCSWVSHSTPSLGTDKRKILSQNPKPEMNFRRIYLTPKKIILLSSLVKCIRGVQDCIERAACFKSHILY